MVEITVKNVDRMDGSLSIVSLKAGDSNQDVGSGWDLAIVSGREGSNQVVSGDVCYIKAGVGSVQTVNGVKRIVADNEADKWWYVVESNGAFVLCNKEDVEYVERTVKEYFGIGEYIATAGKPKEYGSCVFKG